MYNTRVAAFVFAVALGLGGHYCALAQDGQDDILSIAQLRARASDRPARFSSLRVSLDVFQEPAPNSPIHYIPHVYRSVLVDAATGRFSVDRRAEMEVAGHDGEPETVADDVALTFDGDIQAAFLPDQMIGIIQEGADVNGLAESGLWGVMLPGEPQPDGLGIDDGSLESLLAHGAVRDQLELVGDTPCHVVDAFYEGVRYATIWLDVERGLLPLKRVGYGSNGEASSMVTVESVVFLEDEQVWLPEAWQTEIQARGDTLRTYTVVEPESVEINPPFTNDVFRPEFPPGTIVTDQIAGIAYRVSDSGDIGEMLYERSNGEWVTAADPIVTEGVGQRGSVSPPPSAERQARRTKAPIFNNLAELMEFARAQASKQPERTEPDAGEEPTNPADPTERHALDSKQPARSASTPTAPVDVKSLDVSQGRSSTPPPGSDGTGAGRARTSRLTWRWIVGAAVVLALLGVGYSAVRRSTT